MSIKQCYDRSANREAYNDYTMTPEYFIDILNSVSDLSEIVKIRVEFKKNFPKEFLEYMEDINRNRSVATWSGCFRCKHYIKSNCSLGKIPQPLRRTTDKLEYYCPFLKSNI